METATELFVRFAEGDLTAITSEITLSELLVKPLERRQEDIALSYVRLLTQRGPVTMRAVTIDILMRSAEIRARVGGKLPDAIHVATALDAGCEIILSSDQRMPLLDPLRRIGLEDLNVSGLR